MPTYSVSGTFQLTTGQAINGAPVSAWKASRFGSPPAYGAAFPSGTADATTTTGTSAGGAAGEWTLQLPTAEPYYVAVTWGGLNSWQLVNALPFKDGTSGSAAEVDPPVVGGYAIPAGFDARYMAQSSTTGPTYKTQGLYARTQPTPNNGSWSATMRPLVVDPNTTGGNGTGRIWYSDQEHDYIAYTDDDGATGYLCGINPDHSSTPAKGIQGLVITTNYFWLYTTSTTESPCSGRIWRAAYSSTPGTLSWTLIWDMNGQALGTGGASSTGNTNGCLRNSSVAVSSDETVLAVGAYGVGNYSVTRSPSSVTDGQMTAGLPYLYSATAVWSASDLFGPSFTVAGAGASGANLTGVTVVQILSPQLVRLSAPAETSVSAATVTFASGTYGAGIVIGGPQIWVSSNPTAASPTFTAERTFHMAKHCHAVKYINGVFWASFGDTGHGFTDQYSYINTSTNTNLTDVGLWNSTAKAATTWNRVSNPTSGGIMLDIINFTTITIDSQTGVLGESDSGLGLGPIWFGSQTEGVGRALNPTLTLPWPYLGTMRTLGVDATTGNAYWIQTGESGAVGPLDTIVMAPAPYNIGIVLESTTANSTFTGSLGDPVISNGYFWIGTYRCVKEKLVGQ